MAREVGGLLSRTPRLAHFIEQCQFHAAIYRELQSRLPEQMASHCLSCVARPDRLVVFTDSGTHATPLRFALASALPTLRQQFEAEWQRVQIRVFPTWQPDRRLRELAQPRPATIEHLATAAATTPDDAVSAALLRLATTLRQRPRD